MCIFRLNFISSHKHAASIVHIAKELLNVFMTCQDHHSFTLGATENFVAVLRVGAQSLNLVATFHNAADSSVSDSARRQTETHVNYLLDRTQAWLTNTLPARLYECDFEAASTEIKVTAVYLSG